MSTDATVALPAGFIDELAAATSRQRVLTAAAKWMPRILEAERSSIALPTKGSTTELQIYAMSGSLIIPQGTLLPISESIVGQAYSSQQIVNIGDLALSRTAESERLTHFGLQSAIVCPMVIGGRSLGTINLGNSKTHFFGDDDEILLRSVVDLIASFLSAHERAQSEYERAATDHLTSSMSRVAILDHLETTYEDPQQQQPSVLYLDVDGFKAINDTHGHSWGDEMLRVLARRISGSIRPDDRMGRLGGDEFLVVIAEDPSGAAAEKIAHAIQASCINPITFRSVSVRPKVSVGVASPTEATTSAVDLLHDADQAMYTAKGTPSPIAIANDAIREHAAMVATIDRDLDIGMRTGAITYHFQPIRDITTREIMGAEALIRWSHPRFGMIPAPLLVERLEATGRTDAFTKWSARAVMSNWAELRADVPWFHDKAASLNLTPRQLAWPGYVDFHMAALDEFGYRPQDIIIEVVESSEINNGDPAEHTLQQLGQNEVVIALDDFGTGHNALGYFTRFPIHAIKFDRSLVGVAVHNDKARTILAGLAGICHELGVVSLGEGVETEAEARLCQQLGITHGQGWHFGHPGPLASLVELARSEEPGRARTSTPGLPRSEGAL